MISKIQNEKWNSVYSRQSLDKKESMSIEFQIEKAMALIPEGELIKEYTDKGYSGKNMKRPEFQQMIEDVKKGMVKRIVVYRIDRFSRSLLDFCDTWEILSSNGVEFISVNERFDTSTPMGKAMLFILMIFAQLERETIAERVKDNYYSRTGLGQWPGGPAPAGFDITKITEFAHKCASLMSNQYMIHIKNAFTQYATIPSSSLSSIGRYLYENIPGEWANTTTAKLIRNPAYVKADEAIYYFFSGLGIKIINPVEDFDGIRAALLVGKNGTTKYEESDNDTMQLAIATWNGEVESNIWLACQDKIGKNVSKKNNGHGKWTWLTGLLKCGYCGKAMLVYRWQRKYGEYKYLTCSRRNKRCPHHGSYPTLEELENEVSKRIVILFKGCKNKVKKNRSREDELKNALAMNEQKLNNFISVIGNGASELTVDIINKEIEKLNTARLKLIDEIAAVQRNSDMIQIPKIVFPELSFEDKKEVAASVIERINIFEDRIEIKWKI